MKKHGKKPFPASIGKGLFSLILLIVGIKLLLRASNPVFMPGNFSFKLFKLAFQPFDSMFKPRHFHPLLFERL
jgi:hypothetical protein